MTRPAGISGRPARHLWVGLLVTGACLAVSPVAASTAPDTMRLPTENDYYRIETIPLPEHVILEVGGLATLPDGRLAAATRRGDVWIIENPYDTGKLRRFRKFAHGLHEPLGLLYRDGSFYTAQRGELTRLRDIDGDGEADQYRTIASWPLSGHFHEYSFGPALAPNGDLYVTTNIAFQPPTPWLGVSSAEWRGWALRIGEDGAIEPFATGMRSPAGLAFIDGELFYADNQGEWIASGGLVHLEKGDFTGHPAGLRWASHPESPLRLTQERLYEHVDPRRTPAGERPSRLEDDPNDPGTPLFELEEQIPEIKVPAVWIPHGILGTSTSGILVDDTAGDFGPFSGQLFVGDQGSNMINRIFLERVGGVYQGAVFPFRRDFPWGVFRLEWGADGSLFVGQTARGWNRGKEGDLFGVQRVIWTGQTPFEMKAIRAMPDGFEIEFTTPADHDGAADPASYEITSFTYKYHAVYGSPIIRRQTETIRGVAVSENGLKARLVVDGLRPNYIHEIRAEGVRSLEGNLPLLHDQAYYTLNQIPEGKPLRLRAREHTAAAPEERVPAARRPVAAAALDDSRPRARAEKNPTERPGSWGAAQTIVLTAEEGLRFETEEITVRAGNRIEFTFVNPTAMLHNVVFTLPGRATAVGEAAMRLGLRGAEMHYVPDSEDVLYFTAVLPPGASETIYITAPEEPGEYEYVCSVPGHASSMRGTLKVVPSR